MSSTLTNNFVLPGLTLAELYQDAAGGWNCSANGSSSTSESRLSTAPSRNAVRIRPRFGLLLRHRQCPSPLSKNNSISIPPFSEHTTNRQHHSFREGRPISEALTHLDLQSEMKRSPNQSRYYSTFKRTVVVLYLFSAYSRNKAAALGADTCGSLRLCLPFLFSSNSPSPGSGSTRAEMSIEYVPPDR